MTKINIRDGDSRAARHGGFGVINGTIFRSSFYFPRCSKLDKGEGNASEGSEEQESAREEQPHYGANREVREGWTMGTRCGTKETFVELLEEGL